MTKFEVWKRKKVKQANVTTQSSGLQEITEALKHDLMESGYYS